MSWCTVYKFTITTRALKIDKGRKAKTVLSSPHLSYLKSACISVFWTFILKLAPHGVFIGPVSSVPHCFHLCLIILMSVLCIWTSHSQFSFSCLVCICALFRRWVQFCLLVPTVSVPCSFVCFEFIIKHCNWSLPCFLEVPQLQLLPSASTHFWYLWMVTQKPLEF